MNATPEAPMRSDNLKMTTTTPVAHAALAEGT